ncbi:MAG: prephenate dehydratase domain-containing protein [Syntrophorhabdales bacterium]|jgi:prephenate dehydratase/chorismate mutase/prephenate dehydratase
MDLKEIRSAIDTIDYEIVNLISRRMEHALRLKRLKNSLVEPEREREVLEQVRGYSHNVMEPAFTERLYRAIIEEARRIQTEEMRLMGFQGEHGAYSEVAARRYDPDLVPIPCESFHEVFGQVETGQLDYGIVPVENSLEGAVTEVNDMLVETRLRVVGEVSIPVHHCLLALPEQDYRDLRAVYSHPQALGQCRESLKRHKLEARPFYDTAGAAIMLREQRPAACAVLASRLCADLYHLEILNEGMEDNDSNATRFLVLSRDASPDAGDKCSIIFSVSHRPGGLFSVLKALSDAAINMTRIESRPLRTILFT